MLQAGVISVNVGRPQEHEWRGLRVKTAIFKSAVEGPVVVRNLNLEGDEQGDLTVHGGVDKAVYAYPHEHYAYWQSQLPNYPLTLGNFGENLTVEGLSEEAIHVGNQLQIGTALFTVTQPRSPCYKLGIRFNREDMTRRFYESRRFGFYLRVLREGTVQAGEAVTVVREDPNLVSVADVIRLFTGDSRDKALLGRALKLSTLPQGWRDALRERVEGRRGAQS
jgi:MOSC domain-containing protein YiiM